MLNANAAFGSSAARITFHPASAPLALSMRFNGTLRRMSDPPPSPRRPVNPENFTGDAIAVEITKMPAIASNPSPDFPISSTLAN